MNRRAEFGNVRRQRRARLGLAGWLVVLGMAACGGQEREKTAPDAVPLDGDAWSAETVDDASSDAADVGGDSSPVQVTPWLESRPWKLSVAESCPPLPTSDDRYAELLAALGLDRDVGIGKAIYEHAGGFLAGDPQRLAHFHDVQADIDGLGLCWANQVVAEFDGAAASDHPMTSLVATAASALGVQIDVGGPFVLMDPAQPLVEALRAVHIVAGEDFDEVQVAAAAATVPMAVQRVAARVLLGALDAVAGRDAFLAKSGDSARYGAWFQYGSGLWVPVKGGALDPGAAADAKVFELDVGYRDLFGGAGRLLQAIDEADLTSARSDAVFAFSTTTPWGRVAIRGGGDDTWDDLDLALKGDILLALDTGGDDTWFIRAGANTSVQNPVAVAIDLGGKDTYTYREKTDIAVAPGRLPPDRDGVAKTPGRDWLFPQSASNRNRQGSGRLGYGVLVDLGGGADVYRSPRMSQGHALFGVGVLWDDGGADHYSGERAVQGAAFGGIGLLYDGGGDDDYRAFQSSQGFGWMSSFGAVYDRAGDDDYECVVDEVLVFASPQTPNSANASLCQGTGFGLRRDSGDDHRSGGIGLMRDRAGADRYEGSTFVQGTGYWFGTGILADAGGADTYDGLFYAQGAAAHFGLGFLLEGGGNDRYNEVRKPLHSVLGLGHDFSSAILVDESGDDRYRGASRAMGASKCHGHGIFVDNGGSDRYEALDDKSIGWATDYDSSPGTCGQSNTTPSYGFFVDVGGTDTYIKPNASAYGDGKTWISDDPDDPDALERGGGIDAPSGDSSMHVRASKD